jgi:uncharacterized protein
LGWTAREWLGIEHVIVSADPARIAADSQMILADGDLARVDYRIECDTSWRFIRLDVTVTKAAGRSRMSLSVDDEGHWYRDDIALPGLEGCVDIDIDRSPLTNTLPIRRLTWLPGAAQDLDVAYVSFPDLGVRPVRQRYTLLSGGDAAGEAMYRYESGDYRADLPVDADSFVTDYPGLWDRIWPARQDKGAPVRRGSR